MRKPYNVEGSRFGSLFACLRQRFVARHRSGCLFVGSRKSGKPNACESYAEKHDAVARIEHVKGRKRHRGNAHRKAYAFQDGADGSVGATDHR